MTPSTETLSKGRFRRHTPAQMISSFWAKVDRSAGPDGCWTWTGAVTSKWGYGCFNFGGRVLGAHRIAWILTNGGPGKLCVLHKCDNRVCCNPAHFVLGTKKDNSADAVAKDRHARGDRNRRSKLTDEKILEIRREYTGTTRGQPSNAVELAARYGVTRGTIVQIAKGELWGHIK